MSEGDYRESLDYAVADGFITMSDSRDGLPGFLGVVFTEFAPGHLCAEMEVRPELLTTHKHMHNGVLAALCDHLLGCVCYRYMQPGQWAATKEVKLNHLASVSEGRVSASAAIVSMTRSTAVVRIDIANEGRLACIAQGTVLIRDAKK